MKPIRNVLLDRDGTVIVNKHYLADPAGVELLPGAAEGAAALASAGIGLFLVTNQSGIGRGLFTEKEYHACHAALVTLLRDAGAALKDMAFCPHGPDGGCECRKPRPGMWLALSERHGLDARTSVMVGDTKADVLFGRAAGLAATVLVLTGGGMDVARESGLPLPAPDRPYVTVDAASTPGGAGLPHVVARTLAGAARWVLDQNAA